MVGLGIVQLGLIGGEGGEGEDLEEMLVMRLWRR